MIGKFEYTRPDLNLSESVANIGDYSSITSVFFCLPEFKFNSIAEFLNSTYWLNAIAEKYMFPFHNILDCQPQHEDSVYQESSLKFRYKKEEGKYRFVFSVNCDIEYSLKLKAYSEQRLYMYMADINGNIYGKKNGANVEPFSLDFIHVSKPKFGGASLPGYTDITVDLIDSNEIINAYIDKPTWDASEIVNIECSIQSIVLDTDTLTFDVIAPGDVPVNGLVLSDFTIIDSINGLQTANTFSNSGDGEYTFESTENLYSGTIKLKNANYNGLANYALATLPQYNPTQYNNLQYSV